MKRLGSEGQQLNQNLVYKRAFKVSEPWLSPVLVGQDGVGFTDWPVNGERRIIPQQSMVMLAGIERGNLVEDNRVSTKRAETMGETLGDQ